MNELTEVLATKESKLAKKQAWFNEVGMGKLDDEKLAKKRIKVRKEINELISDIAIIKEMIAE